MTDDSLREKRREEKEYTYTYIRIPIVSKFTLYVPKPHQTMFQQLRKILQAEKRSVSDLAMEFFNCYANAHSQGNPQTYMTTFLNSNAPSPMKVVCSFLRGATNDGHVLCEERPMSKVWKQGYQCYGCQKNQLRRKE